MIETYPVWGGTVDNGTGIVFSIRRLGKPIYWVRAMTSQNWEVSESFVFNCENLGSHLINVFYCVLLSCDTLSAIDLLDSKICFLPCIFCFYNESGERCFISVLLAKLRGVD